MDIGNIGKSNRIFLAAFLACPVALYSTLLLRGYSEGIGGS